MKSFLQSVGAVLTTGLKASIQIEGLGNGAVKLIYTPEIGPTPENASEAVIQLRAAISKPMVVSGTPEEIESAFADLIANKAAVVGRGLGALDEIERLASKAVDEAKAKHAGKPAAAPVGRDDDDGDEAEATELQPPASTPVAVGSKATDF